MNNKFRRILGIFLVVLSIIVSLAPHVRLRGLRDDWVFSAHIAALLAGYVLIYTIVQLSRRKRTAAFATMLLLGVLSLSQLIHGHHNWKLLVYAVATTCIAWNLPLYVVKSKNFNLRKGVDTSLLLVAAAIAYGTAGFYTIQRSAFGIDISLIDSLRLTFIQLFTFSGNSLVALTRHGELFLHSLDLISFAALVLVLASLYGPVRFTLRNGLKERKLAEEIIRSNSSSVEDYFKLWPADKHYFFSQKRDALLAYRVQNSVALVLDGPTGRKSSYRSLMRDFDAFCQTQDWKPAVIHADKPTTKIMDGVDFKQLFIGNEAVVSIPDFTETTVRSKHFRYITNKAARENMITEYWQPPYSELQLSALRRISDAWLSIPGRREYTYFMGYFDENYLQQCDIMVVKKDEEIVAYTNILPSFRKGEYSIDHMRHIPGAPDVVMHFMLKSLILRLGEADGKSINLGLVPLSGIDELEQPSRTEKLLSTVKRLGSRYYSFGGLEQFKNKFKPEWEPRYIAYKGFPSQLLLISNALNRASAYNTDKHSNNRYILAAFAAAISYLSFLLAPLIGIKSSGLASELGAIGAPYNWVFNGLDVLCGTAIITLTLAALRQNINRRAVTMGSGLMIGATGTILAALSPLNPAYAGTDMTKIFHIGFSGLAAVGFYAAAMYYTPKTHTRTYRFTVGITIILGFISVLPLNQETAGFVQRIHLGLTAVLIFVLLKALLTGRVRS